MRNILLSILLIIIATSCYERKPEETAYEGSMIIPRDTMEMVLLDIHLIDGAHVMEKKKGKAKVEIADSYFQMILKKYSISKERFDESLSYYTYHVDEMDEMFEKVIEELGRLESEKVNAR
jgi:hypothetical protein